MSARRTADLPIAIRILPYIAFALGLAQASSVTKTISVADFGAVPGDGRDDATAIQRAVDSANVSKGVVHFPPGVYQVARTIHVTRGEFYGSRLEGANAEAVRIVSSLPGTEPVFSFRGGAGKLSNVGIKNLSISPDSAHAGKGTGIYVDGQGFGIFENLRLSGLARGIWLHNQSPGSFTEGNQFRLIHLDHCGNGIRIEQGKGTESFNGNSFTDVFLNVGARQIGFNHLSGYYYNGRFRLSMWAKDNSSVFVNADGNAEHNIGDISFESGERGKSDFGRGRLTGKGRFWFNGYFRGIGPFVDETGRTGSGACQKVFACDNYWKPAAYGASGMAAGPLGGPMDAYNGPIGYFQSLRKPNVESVLLNTYAGHAGENGLYLGTSPFQCGEDKGTLGLFLGGDGTRIKSYAEEPMRIEAKAVAIPGGRLAVGAVEAAREALEVDGNAQVTGGVRAAGGFWSGAAARDLHEAAPVKGALEKVGRLKPLRYRAGDGGASRVGLAAEEVEKVYPELVLSDGERKFVDYARLAPVLLAALQEQQTRLEAQERRLDSVLAALRGAGVPGKSPGK